MFRNGPSRRFPVAGRGRRNVGLRQVRKAVHSPYLHGWVLSTINAGLMLTPRILFAMARDGLLPQSVTVVNKGGTPTVALFLCSFASIILVLTGTFESLIAIAAILFVANYLRFCRLVGSAKTGAGSSPPLQGWLYPWTTLCVLFASAAFLVGSVIGDLRHSLFTVILILLSYVAALLITRSKA
jgi:L-asparagine transporter-like permease